MAGGFALAILLFVLSASYYVSKPSMCAYCHPKEANYHTLPKASHYKVSCKACHQKSGFIGALLGQASQARMIVTYLLGTYESPIRATVENAGCANCHEKQIENLITKNGIRVSHREFVAEGAKCTDCHNTIPHDKVVPVKNTPSSDRCAGCHNDSTASSRCSMCHVDTVSMKHIAGSPWATSHGPSWGKTHGMTNLNTCGKCHDKSFCKNCHKIELPHPYGWQEDHRSVAKQLPDACQVCHRRSFCTDCHRIEMPHPSSFLPNHKNGVHRLGKKVCLRCHFENNCVDCHASHIHPGLGPAWRKK